MLIGFKWKTEFFFNSFFISGLRFKRFTEQKLEKFALLF